MMSVGTRASFSQESPHAVLLPVCRLHHLFDAGPLGLAQQYEHALLLGQSLDLWFIILQQRLGDGDSMSVNDQAVRRVTSAKTASSISSVQTRNLLNVCGPKDASDRDAANARNIVARVEREPTSVKINFEPGIVVHRRRVRRHAYVPQESICIARRNIHAAAKRHRQMGEIATDALALCVGLEGGAGRARMCVTKGQAVADEIANRLNPSPARRLGSEKLPGDVRELVGLAI